MEHTRNCEKPPLWAMWWHSLDRWSLGASIALILIGLWLIMTVSPIIALQHNWTPFVLLKKHVAFLIPGLLLLTFCSWAKRPVWITSGRIVFLIAWMGMWLVLWWGPEIKGAKRWLSLGGMSLQPSEFIKPAFALITADILSRGLSFCYTFVLLILILIPLFLQPDLGMIALISAVWFGQCFVAGLPLLWTGGIILGAGAGLGLVCCCCPHALCRIQSFCMGQSSDPFGRQYQIGQALKSFASGGLWGKGPGAGHVIHHLPDGHADFIFAVAGEELGLLMCLGILTLYMIIILRSFWHLFHEMDNFYFLAIVGILLQLMLQTFCNMASVMHLIPTKGMTLPLVSYGGSSLLATCWSVGMLLAFTRRYRDVL